MSTTFGFSAAEEDEPQRHKGHKEDRRESVENKDLGIIGLSSLSLVFFVPFVPLWLIHDLFNRMSVVDVEALAAGDFELATVQPQEVQEGGVHVRDVVPVLDRVEP